jgi:L-ascorbate metabolism protein UlaG (beta-lactamase superfamily)
VVWIDPLSRGSLRDLVGRRVVPPSEIAIATWIDRADAVLVGHTHFDHALDVPAIAGTAVRRAGSRPRFCLLS